MLEIFCLPRTNVLSGPAKRCNMPTVNAQRTPLANFCQIHLHPSSIIFICGNATLGRSASHEIREKNKQIEGRLWQSIYDLAISIDDFMYQYL